MTLSLGWDEEVPVDIYGYIPHTCKCLIIIVSNVSYIVLDVYVGTFLE